MMAGARNEGGVQLISVRVRKTIHSIKEVVGSHSDAEIYAALKECNMDPDETTQTLLNQDPFHEVKRKKDKKRENTGRNYRNFTDANRHNGHAGPGMKVNTYLDGNNQRGHTEITSAGASREFRSVKDKQAYSKFNGEPKPLVSNASSPQVTLQVSEKSSLVGNLNNQKRVASSAPIATPPKETSSTVVAGKELPKESTVPIQASAARVEVEKPIESSHNSKNHVSNNSEVGVQLSSDPVHVPSFESSNVGAIKKEVGKIDVQSQHSENYDKLSAIQDISVGHSLSASTDTTEGLLKNVDKEMDQLQDKTKEVDTKEKSNVVFADHIRVIESNSTQLIFGSFGQNIEFSNTSISDSKNDESGEEKDFTQVVDHPLPSISSSPEEEEEVPNAREVPAGKNIDDLHDEPNNEHTKLISQDTGAMNPHDSSDNLPTFSAYYGYSIPYHRPPTMGDNVSSQGLQPHQEALTSSSMVMQQQPLLAQMYPQVHVSQYGNLMPIHQFLSSTYVPPTMTISGFSNNPTSYPPPQTSNGNNSYLLMPGGSSSQQLAASAANPIAGFGNYAINSAGGASSAATGLDDLNHYVSNPQQPREGSEMWIQNARQVMGMQQPYFYTNMAGQSAHGNYLQMHAHPSITQPCHVQFPGLYHPSSPLPPPPSHHTTADHRHLVGNITPGSQMGGYQQSFWSS